MTKHKHRWQYVSGFDNDIYLWFVCECGETKGVLKKEKEYLKG